MPPKSKKGKKTSFVSRLAARQQTGIRAHGQVIYGSIKASKSLSSLEDARGKAVIVYSKAKTSHAKQAVGERLENINKKITKLKSALLKPGRYFWEDGLPIYRPPPPTGGGGGPPTIISAT